MGFLSDLPLKSHKIYIPFSQGKDHILVFKAFFPGCKFSRWGMIFDEIGGGGGGKWQMGH